MCIEACTISKIQLSSCHFPALKLQWLPTASRMKAGRSSPAFKSLCAVTPPPRPPFQPYSLRQRHVDPLLKPEWLSPSPRNKPEAFPPLCLCSSHCGAWNGLILSLPLLLGPVLEVSLCVLGANLLILNYRKNRKWVIILFPPVCCLLTAGNSEWVLLLPRFCLAIF